jgi:probable HAF family extracellular repeat protein
MQTIVFTAFLWPLCAQAEIRYEVIDLGTLGGDYSWAYSISDRGQIVGQATASDGHFRATLFDPTGAGNNIDLGTLGGDESDARSINDAGQIVGSAHSSQGVERAALFDPTGAGNNIDLGTLGGDESDARSINDAGQIAGWAHSSHDVARVTLFDPTGAGNNIDLGYGWASSINSAGQIVGGLEGPWGECLGFLYDPSGASRTRSFQCASCINDAGQFVASADGFATLFDATGARDNVCLGAFGGRASDACSINDAGQIVGYSFFGPMCHDPRATLFDPTGRGNNADLNTLIDPASGWTLTFAKDINNPGWIVGEGINPEGEVHAFLLVPKAPRCPYALAGDVNDDCRVDFRDVAILAENWLVDCESDATNPACIPR